MEEEILFPRGKPTPRDQSNKVTSKPSEDGAITKKKKRARSDSGDFLFGGPSSGKELIGKKSKSKRRDGDDVTSSRNDNVSMMPLGGGAVLPPLSTGSGSKRPALIESLSFSKLSKGMKLLGMVREVSEEYAVISLPNMWTGFLVRKQNGVPLTRVVSVNQVLPVIVQKTTTEESKKSKETPKRRIELSVDPIHINMGLAGIPSLEKGRHIRGVISSCEDHGCLVDIGIPRVRCFLSYDKIQGGKYRLLTDSEDDDSVDEDEESDDEGDGSGTSFKLNKGRIYDFTILSLPSNEGSEGIIQLALQKNESICKHTTTQAVLPSANATLRTLLPGMLVTAYVEQFAKNGLCVSFLNNVFRGSIDMTGIGGFYSPDLFPDDDSSKPKTGTKNKEEAWFKNVFTGKFRFVKARIIVVDHVSKIIRLSLQSHVLYMTPPKNTLPPVGTVIENAKVVRLDSGIGALLALPPSDEHDMDIDDNEDNEAESHPKPKKNSFTNLQSNKIYARATAVQCCYVHISKAMDGTNVLNSKKKKKKGNETFRTPETLFAKHFSVNTTISKLRILNISHWMDNIASCATAESIVSAAVLSHSDILPGAVYKSVPIISSLSDGSVLVQLGIGVKGIVPNRHLFDKAHMAEATNSASGFRNNSRMDKYKVGNMIDVRCLTVSLNDKKCVLTAKKSLLASDLENGTAIVNYANIAEGQVATGFISKVDKSGIFVTFYNNVYGRVSARRLAEELGVEDPTVNYTLGDVAKARVIKCLKMNQSQDDDDDEDEDIESYYSLELTLNTAAPVTTISDSNSKTSNIIVKAGTVLPPKSMKIVELVPSYSATNSNSSSINYIPGYALVSIKSKFLDISPDDEANDVTQTVKCKLPFDQLLDHYNEDMISTSENLDALSMRVLKVGKKIAQKGIILTSGRSSVNSIPVLSLRANLIDTAEQAVNGKNEDKKSISAGKEKKNKFSGFLLPSPSTSLFVGAYTHGYCIRHDPRYGAFIRFLDNLTGLVPKVKGGLDIPLFETINCKVIALDIIDGKNPKILLKQTSKSSKSSKSKKLNIKPGDLVGDVKLEDINFARVKVSPLQKKFGGATVRARIHVTMAEPTRNSTRGNSLMPLAKGTKHKNENTDVSNHEKEKITRYHPFHSWKIGSIITDTICISVDERDGIYYLELTNRKPLTSNNDSKENGLPPVFVERASELLPGTLVNGIITSVSPQNKGVWVQVCPGVTGFISGLELSEDVTILNKMSRYYKVGGRIGCCVMKMDEATKEKKRKSEKFVRLSSLMYQKKQTSESSGSTLTIAKPLRGNVVVARVNRFIKSYNSPSLMLDLRGNYQCRCDVTEIADVVDWMNMPLGRNISPSEGIAKGSGQPSNDETEEKNNIVTDEELETAEELENEEGSDDEHVGSQETGLYHHGTFVNCCVLSSGGKSNPYLEVSLRQSRIDGNLDNDEPPKEKELVRAYVVKTTKKGCFVRLSRTAEGRILLKELSDSFLPNPVDMFPPGRLVVGKVKAIRGVAKKSNNSFCKFTVDLDMRESKLLESQDKINFEDIKVSNKYKGVVTRVESYGVFVRLENSDIIGLVHISECSDDYVKAISSLYDPGDLVKVKVVKMDNEKKQVSLSLKASHFEDDSDSDDDSSSESGESDFDEEMLDVVSGDDESDIDSDDENFASKLAAKMNVDDDSDQESSGSENESEDDSSDSESSGDDSSSSEEESEKQKPLAMDTDVGFDWGTEPSSDNKKKTSSQNDDSDSSSDESSDEEEIDTVGKSSHKSRKKAAAKRQAEREILVRESALADGTADENPETTADFERILASDPNSSENYIRYMAYHLSLADIESARNIADRAFNRIEFRQEGEKLNVWTALLTLEMKYGNRKKFNETVDRACQHNNPKKVYLRVCEMLEREIDKADQSQLATATSDADEMFSKMCKKFKSKKTVWISHLQYLLKSSRHEEAHALLKRSLTSLPEYKHVETMSKFAQQEYEYGSVERARTIFDALIEKQKKRLDLLFVYVDKEIKHGDIEYARNIFEKISNAACDSKSKNRFNDKQMKGLFKKWYRMEDEHGNEESRQNVKLNARAYVERNSS